MEPLTMPSQPPQRPSHPSAPCTVERFNAAGVTTTPGSASGSDTDEVEQSLVRHVTPRPSQSKAEVLFSPLNTGLTSQTMLPEMISSAHLGSGAQPCMQIAVRRASVDEVTHPSYPAISGEDGGTSAGPIPSHPASPRVAAASVAGDGAAIMEADNDRPQTPASDSVSAATGLSDLPNEILLQILRCLDVCDLLCTSRTSHRLRDLSLAPILHAYRLQRTRTILPPMLWSPFRPSLAELVRRSIFLTRTTVVSRKLARSLVCIRLSRRLAARPSVEALVARSVLPPECLPTRKTAVAPALVAKKRAVERERVKDTLRRWVERVWRGEVMERSEGVKQWEERVGVGRVWRLRRFWESVGRMDGGGAQNR